MWHIIFFCLIVARIYFKFPKCVSVSVFYCFNDFARVFSSFWNIFLINLSRPVKRRCQLPILQANLDLQSTRNSFKLVTNCVIALEPLSLSLFFSLSRWIFRTCQSSSVTTISIFAFPSCPAAVSTRINRSNRPIVYCPGLVGLRRNWTKLIENHRKIPKHESLYQINICQK